MNPLLLMLIIGIITAVFSIIAKKRNDSYANSEKGKAHFASAEEFAKNHVKSYETLLILDCAPQTSDVVALTDQGIYYGKKGNLTFEARYADIVKCTYMNFTGDKVKPQGDVFHIKIKSNNGKCALYSFTKAKEIALELSKRIHC